MTNKDFRQFVKHVDEMPSEYKTDLILSLFEHILTEEQQNHVLKCLEYNVPFKGDHR